MLVSFITEICMNSQFRGYRVSARIFVTGSKLQPDNFQSDLDRLEGRLS